MKQYTDEEIIIEMTLQGITADRQEEGIKVIRESILTGRSEILLQDAVRVLKKFIDLQR